MLFLQKIKNKKIAIYGMGKSGVATAKKLTSLKAKIYCWDDNAVIRKKIKRLKYSVNKFWAKESKEAIDYIVISPGIDINKCKIKNYLKKNNKIIITDLDIFFKLNQNIPVISITGTNGKSTTCKIVEKILQTAGYNPTTGGNIGNPVLSIKKSGKKNIFILEISSYQLQYSKVFRSNHAAILNISSDHLERHKNISNYIKVKSKIFFAQKSKDYFYINSTNKFSKSIENIFEEKKIKSKLQKININKSKALLKKIDNKLFESKCNIENLAFAYKIAKNLKINDLIIIKALNKFKGLPHRQEAFLKKNNFTFVNDSKATSFDAAFQSLSTYNNIYWIVGGLPKHKDRFDLKEISKNIIKAYIIGKNTSFFANKIRKEINHTISYNLNNAIKNILNDVKKDNLKNCTILLSPAAASYDQFNNFEERGNSFKNLVIKNFKIN